MASSTWGLFVMANSPLPPSPLRSFYFDYGFFLDAYTAFETLLELLLKTELRLTNEETSITFSGVGFGLKAAILRSLLARNPVNAEKIRMIEEANKAAARNSFAHGFLVPNDGWTKFTLVRREVKEKYAATVKPMTPDTMEAHAKAFYDRVNELLSHCGLKHEDVSNYQKWVLTDALARADLAKTAHQPHRSKQERTIRSRPVQGRR